MKKFLCLFIAAAMLLPLSSCVSSSPEEPAASTDAALLIYNSETDADNRYLNAPDSITELDNVFIWHKDTLGTFYYYDKESGSGGVLCNKPDCTHDSEECGGISGGARPTVWYYEGKLHWLMLRTQNPNERLISRMNLDTTQREIFMTIPDIPELGIPLIKTFLHRGKIFLERRGQVVEQGEPKWRYHLSICDVITHDASEEKTVLEFDAEDSFSQSVLYYCLGSRVYILSNYNDGEYKLMIWMYDIEKDSLSVVTDITFENDDFYYGSFKVTPEGDIYLASFPMTLEDNVKVCRIVDNRLTDFMYFEDEDFIGATPFVCEDTLLAIKQIDPGTSNYRIWVKDYEGNTLYKGELTTGFKEGHEPGFQCTGCNYIYASKERIIIDFIESKLVNTEPTASYDYLIEYEITENGLVEKPLVIAVDLSVSNI